MVFPNKHGFNRPIRVSVWRENFMKPRIYIFLLVAVMSTLTAARAGTREDLMRLQSEIVDVQKQIMDFDRRYSEKLDGLKSLIVQLNDQVGKSNTVLEKLNSRLDSLSTETQSSARALHAEIKELMLEINDVSVSVSVLAQQVNDLKIQSVAADNFEPIGGGLAPESMYNQAHTDFIQGKYEMAIAGFLMYIETYPGGEKVPDALFNTGNAYLSDKKLLQARTYFTRVINEHSQSDVVPAALFKRARIEMALQERDNAIADFRDIIVRFPTSREANNAREELQQLGALRTTPAKPPATQPPAAKTPARTTPR